MNSNVESYRLCFIYRINKNIKSVFIIIRINQKKKSTLIIFEKYANALSVFHLVSCAGKNVPSLAWMDSHYYRSRTRND